MSQKPFGMRLRKIREDHHIQLQKCAEKLDIDKSTLSKIERGINKFVEWEKIEKFFEIYSISIEEKYYIATGEKINSFNREELMKEIERMKIELLESKSMNNRLIGIMEKPNSIIINYPGIPEEKERKTKKEKQDGDGDNQNESVVSKDTPLPSS